MKIDEPAAIYLGPNSIVAAYMGAGKIYPKTSARVSSITITAYSTAAWLYFAYATANMGSNDEAIVTINGQSYALGYPGASLPSIYWDGIDTFTFNDDDTAPLVSELAVGQSISFWASCASVSTSITTSSYLMRPLCSGVTITIPVSSGVGSDNYVYEDGQMVVSLTDTYRNPSFSQYSSLSYTFTLGSKLVNNYTGGTWNLSTFSNITNSSSALGVMRYYATASMSSPSGATPIRVTSQNSISFKHPAISKTYTLTILKVTSE